MGLFSRKERTPRPKPEHPHVERSIFVSAAADAVATQLISYSDLHSPKHAERHQLSIGEADGWVVVVLPPRLHPWTFHNLACWLLDTPGAHTTVVAASAASPDHPGYRLVRDPELGDCLCGTDTNGEGWTVMVPTNDVVRGEPVPAQPPTLPEFASAQFTTVDVLLEDPGNDMNPANEPTRASRARLRTQPDVMFM